MYKTKIFQIGSEKPLLHKFRTIFTPDSNQCNCPRCTRARLSQNTSEYRPKRWFLSNVNVKTKDTDPEEDEHPFESSIDHTYTDDRESTSKRYTTTFEEDKNKRHCTEIEDEYDAIGINVAAKLRGLPLNMRILAEKLINDVLFQAQTNTLTSNTVIAMQDPFK